MWKLISILLFIALVVLFDHMMHQSQCEVMNQQIKEEFKGIVTRKFNKRGDVVCILTKSGKEFEIAIANDWLYDNVIKGDTIIKVANSNTCFIKRDTTFRCDCYHFSASDK